MDETEERGSVDDREKWSELERIERYLKDMEEKNQALQETMAYTRSPGCALRMGAAACLSMAIPAWYMTGKHGIVGALVGVGFALLGAALVYQRILRKKKAAAQQETPASSSE